MEKVIKYLLPFLEEQGATVNGSAFTCRDSEFEITYDSDKQICRLIKKAENGEQKEISTYLLTDAENEKDCECVAIDFADTLRQEFGLKKSFNRTVELPVAEKGDTANMTALLQKLLAIFPERKDTYKAHIEKYGKLLPVSFFADYMIPSVKNLMATGTKKQITKFFDGMVGLYTDADTDTMSYIVTLISAAVYGDEEKIAAVKEYTSECAHLNTSVLNFIICIKKDKKLRNALKIN